MPSDKNGVESLNKCSIDKSKKPKSLESCLDLTLRQDKKVTYEHWFVHSGLPIYILSKKDSGNNEEMCFEAEQSQVQKDFEPSK